MTDAYFCLSALLIDSAFGNEGNQENFVSVLLSSDEVDDNKS